MKRFPIVSTIVVGLAVAAMIALGLWQLLDRAPRKEAYLAQLAANPSRPAIAFPNAPDETLLFRRTYATCTRPDRQRLAGAGAAGFRLIADCGNGLIVQLGTTPDPMFKGRWNGGAVTGFISHAPDARSLIGSLFDHSPQRLMLVADTPAPGLGANGRPDLSSVPNNHLSYAVQWFLFAAIAVVIYVLAVRRRR
ncbi:surfeit locus 1 family protein [Sphingomonas insulae]|uniref:SURF1-like protein n=1 Tax=Sphingomonas insulae TaxID=424800 RepID=A0ABP3T5M3_9SPHN|nr:SURF1 family protein [Sphingomonas insulae]NIJ31172.1 surfeit locus 1 family protein [Sphingomonas insulae]